MLTRLDSRVKIAVAVLFLAILGCSSNPYLLAGAVPPVVVLFHLSGIDWAKLTRTALTFAPFIIFTTFFGLLSGNNEGGWMYSPGITFLRLTLMTMVALLLTGTTDRDELVEGLVYFLSPLKLMGVDVRRLAMILGVGMNYAPLMVDQAKNIFRDTIGAGGFSHDNALSRVSCMLERLLLAAVKKADELEVVPVPDGTARQSPDGGGGDG